MKLLISFYPTLAFSYFSALFNLTKLSHYFFSINKVVQHLDLLYIFSLNDISVGFFFFQLRLI